MICVIYEPCGRQKKFDGCIELMDAVVLLILRKDPNLRVILQDCPHYEDCSLPYKKKKGEKLSLPP